MRNGYDNENNLKYDNVMMIVSSVHAAMNRTADYASSHRLEICFRDKWLVKQILNFSPSPMTPMTETKQVWFNESIKHLK